MNTVKDLDLMIEAAAVEAQLFTGISPALVAARSSLGSHGVAVLSTPGPQVLSKYPKWSKDEDLFLTKMLGLLSEKEMSEILGRTEYAVHLRWKRDLRLSAPSKDPRIMTGNQIANGLAIDSHTVLLLLKRDILEGHRLPTDDVTYVVDRITLLRFIVNPLNWIYFKPERVGTRTPTRRGVYIYDEAFWAYARRLALKKKTLWQDEWWSIGRVAEYHGVVHSLVNGYIRRGKLKATDWGNWWVLKSHATDPSLHFVTGRGKNEDKIKITPRAKAFIVLASAVGLVCPEIALLMGWKGKRIDYVIRLWRRAGILPHIIKEHNLPVYYDEKTREISASWFDQKNRFPYLAKFMRSLDGRKLTKAESKYIARVKKKQNTYIEKGLSMSKNVNRLIHTSTDDCKISLQNIKSMKILNAALRKANELGHKTRAKHIENRINQIKKGKKTAK